MKREFIEWHETFKCECGLDAIVCNNKQCWNKDKCRCEWKELIDKGACDKGYAWNPRNCEFECGKGFNFSDYENCKFRKKLVAPLIKKCTETLKKWNYLI